jgi:hypothetical protein
VASEGSWVLQKLLRCHLPNEGRAELAEGEVLQVSFELFILQGTFLVEAFLKLLQPPIFRDSKSKKVV